MYPAASMYLLFDSSELYQIFKSRLSYVYMDAGDLERRLHEFAGTLRRGSTELTNDVRERAFGLVSDTQQLLSESYELVKDQYNHLDAVVRGALDDIQDAFTEEEIYVIITAVSRAVAIIMKEIFGGRGMS